MLVFGPESEPAIEDLAFNHAPEVIFQTAMSECLSRGLVDAFTTWGGDQEEGGGLNFFAIHTRRVIYNMEREAKETMGDMIKAVQQGISLIALSRLIEGLTPTDEEMPVAQSGEKGSFFPEWVPQPKDSAATIAPYRLHVHEDHLEEEVREHLGEWSYDEEWGLYVRFTASILHDRTKRMLAKRNLSVDVAHMICLEPWLSYRQFKEAAR